MPPKLYSYVIIIDKSSNRKYQKIKDILLKHLLTICEGLAN